VLTQLDQTMFSLFVARKTTSSMVGCTWVDCGLS